MIVQPIAWAHFDAWLCVLTFLGAGVGWWILATSEAAPILAGKTVCRLVGGAWMAVGMALAVSALSVSLIAMNVCIDDGTSWWLYYSIGCWLP